ncbi:hypothetical protein [Robertmurraya siralis]|nr:hypothetical protein [Robertmurraya siralis]
MALYLAFLLVFILGMMIGGFWSDERVKANEHKKKKKQQARESSLLNR